MKVVKFKRKTTRNLRCKKNNFKLQNHVHLPKIAI